MQFRPESFFYTTNIMFNENINGHELYDTMTTNDKQIKLAEALGLGPLRRQTRRGKEHPDGIVVAYKYCEGGGWYSWKPIPDYFNDLNAMHEAEKIERLKLIWNKYRWNLFTSVTGRPMDRGEEESNIMDAFITATAEQRAEAFGKTLNLW